MELTHTVEKCYAIIYLLSNLMRSEMTLNYQVLVERYPFPNGVVSGSIPVVKSSLYLMRKTR
jgi:hypothetical protein